MFEKNYENLLQTLNEQNEVALITYLDKGKENILCKKVLSSTSIDSVV